MSSSGEIKKCYQNDFQVFSDSFLGKFLSKLVPLFKPLDRIISWLLDLRTTPQNQERLLKPMIPVNVTRKRIPK